MTSKDERTTEGGLTVSLPDETSAADGGGTLRRRRSRSQRRRTTSEESDRNPPRRRNRSRSRTRRQRSSDSRTDSSGTSTALPTSSSDGDSTESEGNVGRKGRRRRKGKSKNLYEVLKTHEGILKELTSQIRTLKVDNENRRVEEMANSLSHTTLRHAIQEERGREHRAPETEELVAPKLSNTDCREPVFNKALQAFHSSFRTVVNGKDSHSVRELFQLASASAETNSFSRRQFYLMLRSRVALDSPLGEFVRESVRKQTSMRNFARGLKIYFGRDENYLSALRRYQEFNGKNLSAKEFLVQLRSVSSGLVENQPGGPKNPAADEQTLLTHMREKFFILMPALAESILNRERSGRTPSDSYEFGELLDRYRLSIEANLRGRRSQVNDLSVNFQDSKTLEDPVRNVNKDSYLSITPLEMESLSVHSLESEKKRPENKANRPRTMQLTKQQLNALRDVCYKCGSQSPVQEKDHRSMSCLLYQGKALASYMCSKCQTGVHLPSDCLQADDRLEALRERAKELGTPIQLENGISVNLIDEALPKNE